jgi:hypothetical protein
MTEVDDASRLLGDLIGLRPPGQNTLPIMEKVREYAVGRGRGSSLQPKPQVASDNSSGDDFCRRVLEIIVELSPCPEPTLFVIAATRGLHRSGDGTLDGLSKLLRQSVEELEKRGLVQRKQNQLLVAPPEKKNDDVLELTTVAASQLNEESFELTSVAGSRLNEEILELTTVASTPINEDILILTSELELHERPSSASREGADSNQAQLRTQDQIKSADRKQKAGPTREQIIAAMRRFISDD